MLFGSNFFREKFRCQHQSKTPDLLSDFSANIIANERFGVSEKRFFFVPLWFSIQMKNIDVTLLGKNVPAMKMIKSLRLPQHQSKLLKKDNVFACQR